jgi:hypothetical protein
MLLEEPTVVLDERTAHSAPLPEGVLEHHLDPAIQKRIAVHNLNQIRFLIAPDGKRAVSAEEIKSDEHRRILEDSLQTLLGERIEGTPYLAPSQGMFALGGRNFAEIHAPANIKALAETGVKDFAEALDVSPSSHAARVR